MELALYDPVFGYYRAGTPRVGRTGDYFTSVSVSPLFGRILARQLAACRQELGAPPDFRVVEFGGGNGQLRADILAALPGLDYTVVEAGDPPPPPFTGCTLANELLDAFPVHRVRVVGDRWQEVYVAADGNSPDGLREVSGELSDPRLAERLRDLPVHLMEGYTTEVNLRATDWLRDLAGRLMRGFVLLLDYGLTRAEYFSPQRPQGTLRCYRGHTVHADFYRHPGEQDLTAHVDFDAVMDAATACGFTVVQFTDQAHFLLAAGAPLLRAVVERHAGRPAAEVRAIHQLLHPAHQGLAFKVLLLRK